MLHVTVERIRPFLRKTQSERVWRQHHLEALLSRLRAPPRDRLSLSCSSPQFVCRALQMHSSPRGSIFVSLEYRPSTYSGPFSYGSASDSGAVHGEDSVRR